MNEVFKNPNQLIASLESSLNGEFNKEEVEQYANYCYKVKTETRNGQLKNAWFQPKTIQDLDQGFRSIKNEGLVFDGKHITWQSTGITFDYVAYKNKMLLAYPDSKIDPALVYKNDEFSFKKESGIIRYQHKISDPFNQKDEDIIGAYVVIINERGEFLTTLSKEDLQKHRSVAKTDFIWKQWFKEMCLKTVMKKGCKFHFEDVFVGIEKIDNENYELPTEEVSEKDKLSAEIREALESYKGKDKQDIRKMCAEKYRNDELTRDFVDNVKAQLV